MILRQDTSGTWRTVADACLQYGGERPLSLVFQDRRGEAVDMSAYGADRWDLTVTIGASVSGQPLTETTWPASAVQSDGSLSGTVNTATELLYKYGSGREWLPCLLRISGMSGASETFRAVVPLTVTFAQDQRHMERAPAWEIMRQLQLIKDQIAGYTSDISDDVARAESAVEAAELARQLAVAAQQAAELAVGAAEGAAGSAAGQAALARGYAEQASDAAVAAMSGRTEAFVWAEGSDAAVEALGGRHSAKGWAATAQGGVWGDIAGDISDQSDLMAELGRKADLENGKVPAEQLPAMDYIPNSEKGAANGVATLDANGKVASTELPAMDYAPEPIIGTAAPTTGTVGEVGQLYVNTATRKTYHCTAITTSGDPAVTTYTWTGTIYEFTTAPWGSPNLTQSSAKLTWTVQGLDYLRISDRILIGPYASGERTSISMGNETRAYVYSLCIGLRTRTDTEYSLTVGRDSKSNANCYFIIGNGSSASAKSNALEAYKSGNLYISGGHQQGIHIIPAVTTSVTLTEGCHSHAPAEATTYALPAVADATRTHQIRLCIDFTAVQTYAFVDSTDTAIVPLFTPTIAAGDVYEFRCEYSAMQSRWLIWPVKQGAVSDDYVMQAEVGAANGVAGLDANGLVPRDNLPKGGNNNQWGLQTVSDNGNYTGVTVNTAYGNTLSVANQTTTQIDNRVNWGGAIKPNLLNYAVTAALTDVNHITLNATQQATAQDVIGAAPASLHGSGAPTTSTVGKVGQGYADDDTQKTYTCTKVTVDETDPSNPVTTYTWTADINANGGILTAPLYTSDGKVLISPKERWGGEGVTIGAQAQTLPMYIWGQDILVSCSAGTNRKIQLNRGPLALEVNAAGVQYGAINSGVMQPRATITSTGAFQQAITVIPAATTSHTLAEGVSSHVPDSAPSYVLPTPTDTTRTHEIILDVRFSSTALSYAFEDASGNAITPLSTPTVEDGTVISFLCRYEPLLEQWTIMPVVLGKYEVAE